MESAQRAVEIEPGNAEYEMMNRLKNRRHLMKQMKKQSEMRMDNEKELKAILGPENYKAYKHQAKMHGNHYGKPDHNHVERPVPHEVK
mgnify:CR=1 FL=1